MGIQRLFFSAETALAQYAPMSVVRERETETWGDFQTGDHNCSVSERTYSERTSNHIVRQIRWRRRPGPPILRSCSRTILSDADARAYSQTLPRKLLPTRVRRR